MKLKYITSPFLAIFVLMVGCSKPSIIDKESVLSEISEALTSDLVEIQNLEYSEVTLDALKDLSPTAGVPFRVSGGGTARIKKDLYAPFDLTKLGNAELFDEIYEIATRYEFYDLEYPKASELVHPQSDRIDFEWKSDITFYNNPDTGKLDYKTGPLAKILPDALTTEPSAFVIREESDITALQRQVTAIYDSVVARGSELMEQREANLYGKLATDTIIQYDDDYYRLETPDNWNALVPTLEHVVYKELDPIPFRMVWIGIGDHEVSRTVFGKFIESGKSPQGYLARLRFNLDHKSRIETELELPKVLDGGTRTYGFDLLITESMDTYEFVTTAQVTMEVLASAEELEASGQQVPETKNAKAFLRSIERQGIGKVVLSN